MVDCGKTAKMGLAEDAAHQTRHSLSLHPAVKRGACRDAQPLLLHHHVYSEGFISAPFYLHTLY